MSLDLNEIIGKWDCPPDEVAARVVTGRNGDELLQMRIDLGLLQMFPDERPDGTRYHGLPSVLDFLEHEERVGRLSSDEHFAALDRELCQLNYRRITLSKLAEECLRLKDYRAARVHLTRALRDIELAMRTLRWLADFPPTTDQVRSLRPSLLFNRARLASQLGVVEGRYDDAIEAAEIGADELRGLFLETGLDGSDVEKDPGINYLLELGKRLRTQYGIQQTLNERLEEAIENEDFEAAARIRDEIARRKQTAPQAPSPDQ